MCDEHCFNSVYDAIGKFPISGVTGGNRYSIGSYVGCRNLIATHEVEGGYFMGKYCRVTRTQIVEKVRIQLSMPFHLELGTDIHFQPIQPSPRVSSIGVCLPDSCSDDAIRAAIRLNNLKANISAGGTTFQLTMCNSEGDEVDIDEYDITI